MKRWGLACLPAETTTSLGSQANCSRPLQRGKLLLWRGAWFVFATVCLILTITSLPLAFARLQMVCTTSPCSVLSLTLSSARQLRAMGLPTSFFATYVLTITSITTLVYFAIALVIFWRRSSESMALLTSFMLMAQGCANILTGINGIPWPAGPHILIWKLLIVVIIAFSGYLSDLFLCFFPDWHCVPRWIGSIAIIEGIYTICLLFTFLFRPEWIRLPPLWLFIVLPISPTLIFFFAQIYRFRRTPHPIQRQQTKWVLFGIIISTLGNTVIGAIITAIFRNSSIIMMFLSITIGFLSLLVLPLSIGLAISRSRLWEIDIIINRTLVYATLTICTIGGYMLVVSGLGLLFQSQGNLLVSLFATGMVAVLFQPLREYLQRGVNRLMYGERDDPYALLSRLGKRIEATLTPEATLSSIAEMVAQTLKLPYIAITLKKAQDYLTVATYGKPQEEVVHLPLVYQQEHIGEIIFSQRAPGELFAPADLRLLDDIARQTSVVAHAIHLTSDLQHSRKRLVTAREEERRRLRRDLHDGLGPTLAGLTLKIGAVRNILPPGQVAADLLLTEVNHDIEYAVRDIRRIVYDLHPSTLDELGLVGAIRSWLSHSTSATRQNGVQIMVEVPEPLPSLPAAVEVATYRIVQEALTNVVRHAQAKTCRVLLLLTKDVLHIEVMDDGIGLTQRRRGGIGLMTMHERAAELGGTCKVMAMETQGTCVQACLPLLKE